MPVNLDGQAAQLYDLLYRGGWTLLAFTGRAGAIKTGESAAALQSFRNRALDVYRRREGEPWALSGDVLWDWTACSTAPTESAAPL